MDVLMPQFGETVENGRVVIWHKKPGDSVQKDETLLEVETDKVNAEIPVPVSGTLTEIRIPEGSTAQVGEILAVIAQSGQPKALSAVGLDPQASPIAPSAASKESSKLLSPVVRRLLEKHQLDPSEVPGRSQSGRIRRRDVLAHIESLKSSQSVDKSTDATYFHPFNRIRLRTAQNMEQSKQASVPVVQSVAVDFENVTRTRGRIGSRWKEENGFPLTFLPFIAKAVSQALLQFPHLNGRLNKGGLTVSRAVHLGIAVALDPEGLVVPVIRHSEQMSVAELAKKIWEIARRARSGKLQAEDASQGTYTISNNGAFGTLMTAPIILEPQVAILSVDAILKRPWVPVGGEDRIEVRPVGILTHCFDHRAVDGAYSGAFLAQVREVLETTNWEMALED